MSSRSNMNRYYEQYLSLNKSKLSPKEEEFLRVALQGKLDEVKKFLREGINVNLKGNSGETALINASRYGRTDVVEELLKAGADVNLEDNNGNTALNSVLDTSTYYMLNEERKAQVFKEQLRIVDLLLKAGSDINHKRKDGKRPIHQALDLKDVELILRFVETPELDFNVSYMGTKNPMEYALTLPGDKEYIQRIIDALSKKVDLQYLQEETYKPIFRSTPTYSLTGRPITTLKRVMGFSPPKTQLVQEEYEVDYTRLKRKRPALILNEVDPSKPTMSARIRIKADYGFYPEEIAIPVVRYGKGPLHGAIGATGRDIENPQFTWFFIEPEADTMLFVNRVLITEYKSNAILTMLIYLIIQNRYRDELFEILYTPMLKYEKDLIEFTRDPSFVEQSYRLYEKDLQQIIQKVLPLIQDREYTLQDVVTDFANVIERQDRYPSLDGMQFRERLLFEYGRQIGINAIVFLYIDEVVDLRPRTETRTFIYKVVPDSSPYIQKSYSYLHKRVLKSRK